MNGGWIDVQEYKNKILSVDTGGGYMGFRYKLLSTFLYTCVFYVTKFP